MPLPPSEPIIQSLLDALHYDPATGEFCWRINRANKRAGDIAGNVGPNGYRTIMVDYRSYYAHHLALIFSGKALPTTGWHTDHIDGDKTNNRIENLRVVLPSRNGLNRKKNNKNNKSGASGVWQTPSDKFLAFVHIDGKRRDIGHFASFEEARAARVRAFAAL